jgi:hypothetical protein
MIALGRLGAVGRLGLVLHRNGVIPWTPVDLDASLALWLDAEDTASITLNGSNVAQWDDKSGNGNHVSNGAASTQPAYLTTGWNGKPTVYFTKAGEEFLFKAGVSNFAVNNDFTFASAFEFFQTNNNWDMVAGWRSVPNTSNVPNGGTPVLQYATASATEIGVHNTDVADTRIKVDVTSRLGKKIATVGRSGGTDGNGGEVTVTSTGFSQPTYQTNGTQTWVSAAATGFQVGGRQQDGTAYGDKYISEVVGCNTKLSTEDRQKLEGYLAWKWSFAENLPNDHPYRVDGRFFGFGSFRALSPSGSNLLVTSNGDVFIIHYENSSWLTTTQVLQALRLMRLLLPLTAHSSLLLRGHSSTATRPSWTVLKPLQMSPIPRTSPQPVR